MSENTTDDRATASSATLYIASCTDFVLGQTVAASQRTLDQNAEECEEKLAAAAPSGSHDRRTCFFASDNPAFAAYYLSREVANGRNKKMYRVEMPCPSWHPMILVNAVCRATDQKLSTALAQEYWRPAGSWRCLEYIDVKMKAIAEEEWPEQIAIGVAATRYQLDLDAANRFGAVLTNAKKGNESVE